MRKKLLWIGDAECPSGFAKATSYILNVLKDYYDVTVLGLNFYGDPHHTNGVRDLHPYPIYAAIVGGDYFGVGRLVWMCHLVRPDVIVIQNDPWNFTNYLDQLRGTEFEDVPIVGIIAVDGKNIACGNELERLALGICWTEFGLNQLRQGGFTKPAVVIPLGVDPAHYHPGDLIEARKQIGLPTALNDRFIVGNVNRNQPRKRLDLTMKYFAEWVHSRDVDDAVLFLHVAKTGDKGIYIEQLAKYYGISGRVLIVQPPTLYGVSEEEMGAVYRSFDVQISTTQGEGFGLTTLEGMACGVRQIVPDWAALGEWARGGAELIPCTSTAIGPPYLNIIGGVADETLFVEALDRVYKDAMNGDREPNERAAAHALDPRFDWNHIGEMYRATIEHLVFHQPVSSTVLDEVGV